MALLTIFKEHKLLLGATAILSIGSVVSSCMAQGRDDQGKPVCQDIITR